VHSGANFGEAVVVHSAEGTLARRVRVRVGAAG